MSIEYVKDEIENSYGLKVIEVQKIKNVYRVETRDKIYCFKVVKYELDHFLFILGAINHLKTNGFNYVPNIIKNNKGEEYVCFQGNYAYLTYWINARECNYDNPIDLYNAARKLGELHNKSKDFQVQDNMRPRVGWFKWIETFRTRKCEIDQFRKAILFKDNMSEFDTLYLSKIEQEMDRCDRAIEGLIKANYDKVMLKHIKDYGFCHHDYAHHNILVSQDKKINIIDFDYCILDSYLHDLSSLLIRAMKYGKWDIKKAYYILNSYSECHEIAQEDIPIIAYFMEFPQDFWQRGIQYYWERKPWDEEFFVKKLRCYLEDVQYKNEFLQEFVNLKL